MAHCTPKATLVLLATIARFKSLLLGAQHLFFSNFSAFQWCKLHFSCHLIHVTWFLNRSIKAGLNNNKIITLFFFVHCAVSRNLPLYCGFILLWAQRASPLCFWLLTLERAVEAHNTLLNFNFTLSMCIVSCSALVYSGTRLSTVSGNLSALTASAPFVCQHMNGTIVHLSDASPAGRGVWLRPTMRQCDNRGNVHE